MPSTVAARSTRQPIRVAIVGGGCAALTTAFELSRPEQRGRYQVTVYQMGWRLGGKGASGRGVSNRIEEHGLHLWMGFYENAFRLMRECYAELGRDPATCPVATFDDAFKPAPTVAVVNRVGSAFAPWVAHFPIAPGLPGDPLVKGAIYSVRGYLEHAASLLLELLRSADRPGHSSIRSDSDQPSGSWVGLPPARIISAAEALLRFGGLATTALLTEALALLRAALHLLFAGVDPLGGLALRLINAIADAMRQRFANLLAEDGGLGQIWPVIDLILAILRGSIRFGLAIDPRGFDAINDYDWRDWLRENGASELSLSSGFIRGIYDLVFAYEEGDRSRPALAAGVALRGALRMFFTYRGALFWRMSAGMGDIVFAPLYEVLSRRGVRFEFFQRLRNVRLGKEKPGERPYVEALEFDVQAKIRRGRQYQPLVDVCGLPCWPARPDFTQLQEGRAIEQQAWNFEAPWEQRTAARKQLRLGADFDFVVLGIGIAALPQVASELLAREPRWRTMVERVQTVPTQAFQIWLTKEMGELGWKHPPVNLSGYEAPFDTWADMSHLAKVEDWRTQVQSIAYFCSVFPDSAVDSVDEAGARAARSRVRHTAVKFLERDIAALWPRAVDDRGRFRWELLAADEGQGVPKGRSSSGKSSERFGTQFWTANIAPSERYTLSLPGTIRYRISPLEFHFDNLTIAGDWTQTGLDSGCVESAVMSGLLAAHALSKNPPLSDIVGFDHP